jgi:hypothetical protein
VKRTSTLGLIAIILVVVLSFFLNIKQAAAQNNGYSIQNVDHQVEVMYSGNVVISENITLTGQMPSSFVMGFPYKYGSHILNGLAFDAARKLPINMGVQLGERSGFYGFEVKLPENSSQTFTITFILSNDLLSKTASGYSLDFPVYPSFTKDANRCNVTLVLPETVSGISVATPDGNVSATNIIKENLLAFSYSPAVATFNLPAGEVQQMDVKSLNRLVTIFPAGEIRVSDSFRITNNSSNVIALLKLDLPRNAADVSGKDELGRTLRMRILPEKKFVVPANLTLLNSIGIGQSALVTVEYSLPDVPSEQITHFAFDLDLFPVANYFVAEASLQVIPPEGAHFVEPQLSEVDPSLAVDRRLFQETMEIKKEGVSYIEKTLSSENTLKIAYEYNPLWLSYRLTLWVWAISIVGSVIFAVWRRPKTATQKRGVVPRLSAGLSPDNVRAFNEAYEERRKITMELRVLHARSQKDKIPKNYYKSQRKNLEKRFDALTKDINQLKENFRHVGGNYGQLIRQLDAAEKTLSKARTSIRSSEARHRSGELPTDEYRKALTEYQRKKEKIEAQINEILLRLREE